MTLPVMALFTFVHVPIFLAVLMEKFFAVNSTDCGPYSCFNLSSFNNDCGDYVLKCPCAQAEKGIVLCHIDFSCTRDGSQAALERVPEVCLSDSQALARQGSCLVQTPGAVGPVPTSAVDIVPSDSNVVVSKTQSAVDTGDISSSQYSSTTSFTSSGALPYTSSLKAISSDVSTLLTIAATQAINSNAESPVSSVQPGTASGYRFEGSSKLGIGLGVSLSFAALGVTAYLMYCRRRNTRKKQADLVTAAERDPVTGASHGEGDVSKDQSASVGQTTVTGLDKRTDEAAELHREEIPPFSTELEGSRGSRLSELPGS